MKLFISCAFITIAVLHYCVLPLVSAATVGLYAPDRYEGIPELCLVPMDFGYCRAKVKRYYFDMRRMKCAMFYFGGCAGNTNNFKSMEECNKVCLDAIEDYDNTPPLYNSRDTKTRNSTITSSVSPVAVAKSTSKYNSKVNNIQNRSDDSKVDYDDYEEN